MDIVCMARTGSGKTLAFLVPMIQKLKAHDAKAGVRGIVLSPTRELAMQSLTVAQDLAKFTDLRMISIVGGDGIEAQFDSLSNRPDVIIASPGRLTHHLSEITTFKLKNVSYLVFDEADRLFEMGFAEQINEIVKQCPVERQTLLFSATMPKMLMQFSRAGLRDPQLVRLDTDVKMSEELRLGFFYTRSNEKVPALLYLIGQILPKDQLTIIFTATKHHSEFLYHLLQHIGIDCTLIYGSMDQESRNMNLRSFRLGEVKILIVTDVAARGIDIPLINNVINFHFPPSPKLFVHRCGRAARQGRIGYAFSLVEQDELPYAVDVYRFLDVSIHNGVKAFVDTALTTTDENDSSSSQAIIPYDLKTMTPQQVHVGLLPQDVLDEELEYLKTTLKEHEHLSNMWKVCENGMKQYHRTRTAATHDSVKQSKKLVKSNFIRHIHPLIHGCDPKHCNDSVVEKANFIRMLQTFRPSQTVLETGIGTGCAAGGKRLKTDAGKKGSEVMKYLRSMNEYHLERNRKRLSLTEEKEKVEEENEDEQHNNTNNNDDENDMPHNDEYSEEEDGGHDNNSDDEEGDDDQGSIQQQVEYKPRLSIAEKRKYKKLGYTPEQIEQVLQQKALVKASIVEDGKKSTTSKDPKFYLTYGTEDERANYAEEALQPKSGLRSTETQNAKLLESAMLDISNSNEDYDANKKKKITRWDEKKRKFVKVSLNGVMYYNNRMLIYT